MNVFIVYAHPSSDSFTYLAKEEFIKGLLDAGHTYELSDLYAMQFNETMSEDEYLREGYYDESKSILADVLEEQRKINDASVIVFIYPVFWTEAPAKLVGWFQRVWTYGYAYGPEISMKQLEKAIFFVTMGANTQDKIRQEQVEAMKIVMLGDRIHTRAKNKEMHIFDQMTRGYGNDENRTENQKKYLAQIYQMGKELTKN